jgi:hypothetical protein
MELVTPIGQLKYSLGSMFGNPGLIKVRMFLPFSRLSISAKRF